MVWCVCVCVWGGGGGGDWKAYGQDNIAGHVVPRYNVFIISLHKTHLPFVFGEEGG